MPTTVRTQETMRDAFHEDLDHINDTLVEMAHHTSWAITTATRALLDADQGCAEQVITEDAKLDAKREQLENTSIDLLARQQPVATDLRIVVTAMQIADHLERMGDLAAHVAKIARLRHPESPVAPQLRSGFAAMGDVAKRMADMVGETIAAKDVRQALALEQQDDSMDELHRQNFAVVLDDSWSGSTLNAVDATLISRYYERFADHVVSVGHSVVFLVTGVNERLARMEAEQTNGAQG